MVVNSKRLVIEVEKRGTARMKDVAGTRIDCVRGRIWITEQGLQDDHVLEAYESYTISRNGVTVVQALREAVIGIQSPAVQRAGIMARIERRFRWAARVRGAYSAATS